MHRVDASGGKSEVHLLGIRLFGEPLRELQSAALAAVAERDRTFIFACANPHSLIVAKADVPFRRALERASAVVADGVGCQWGAVLSGVRIGPRITGMDFFLSTMAALNRERRRAFFFGSSDEVLSTLTARVSRDFPDVTIGSLSPPFRVWSSSENSEMIRQIRNFEPDVLWVGMTAPKQETWVDANVEQLAVPVIGSIGAVFDYYAGTTKRAPPWICRLGLEWLYRLPREPKRLWERTFVSAPLFLWYACQERFKRPI